MTVKLRTEKTGAVLVAVLEGELDDHGADGVRQAIDRELDRMHKPYLVVDVAGLSFMDSSGLGVMLGRYRKVAERGGEMRVSGASPSIEKLFHLSGMHKLVQFYHRRGDAIRACREVSQ
jgi:stage II sporulation protein AA (anti-sigma F factor antagonist)